MSDGISITPNELISEIEASGVLEPAALTRILTLAGDKMNFTIAVIHAKLPQLQALKAAGGNPKEIIAAINNSITGGTTIPPAAEPTIDGQSPGAGKGNKSK